MDSVDKEIVLNRIMSSYDICIIDSKIYKILRPSVELKYQADQIYEDILYGLSFEEWLRKDDIDSVLSKHSLWSSEHSLRLDSLEKQLDSFKIEVYKSFLNDTKVKELKKSINRIKGSISSLIEKKTLLDSTTLEHYAYSVKLQYTTALSIVDENENHVYDKNSFWFSDPTILTKVMSYLTQVKLSQEEVRELAKTEPWRNYWSISKNNIFSNSPFNWTDEQRLLVLYSKMYDNTYSHPECPPEKVIMDDDMFDGWMLLEKKKQEKGALDKQIDDMVGDKQKGAGEIFVPASSAEHAKSLSKQFETMNDIETKMKLKQRQAVLEKEGRIEEENLPDVKAELRQQATRQFADRFKGK